MTRMTVIGGAEATGLAELHVHLEGTLDAALVRELARRNQREADLPPLSWLRAGYRWEPRQWLACMRRVGDACLRTPHDYERALVAYGQQLAADGACYAEVNVATARATRLGWSVRDLLSAVSAVIPLVRRDSGVHVRVIAALDYRMGVAEMIAAVRAAASLRSVGVAGIDLQGPPLRPMAEFTRVFELATAAGLGTRAHAGEVQGPASVWQALDILRVDRVAHGTRCVADAALVRRLADEQVPLDMCLSSNVGLGIVPSLTSHPLRRLHDAGVPVTLSSDDPLYFNTSPRREYELAAEMLDMDARALNDMTRVAISRSFAEPPLRASLLRQFADRAAAGATPNRDIAGGVG
jgi:adenosine deaminase